MRKRFVMTTTLMACCLCFMIYAAQLVEAVGAPFARPAAQQDLTSNPVDVAAYINALSSPDPALRASAACELGRAKAASAIPALIEILGDTAKVVGTVQCEGLGSLGSKDVGHDESTPGRHAAIALARIGAPAVDPLIGALRTEGLPTRENAVLALTLNKDERAVEPLIVASRERDGKVRAKAVWGLGLKKDARVVEPLLTALNDAEWQVREKAAWSLGLRGNERAVEPLSAAVHDPRPEVVEKAVWSLGLILMKSKSQVDARVVDALSFALKDGSPSARKQAAQLLGLILMRNRRTTLTNTDINITVQ